MTQDLDKKEGKKLIAVTLKNLSTCVKDIRVGVFLVSELRVLKNLGPRKDIENGLMFSF